MAYNNALNNNRKLAILKIVDEGNGDLIDVHAMSVMRSSGYVEVQNIMTGKRGRPPVAYSVTGKGRSLAALLEINAKKTA